MIHFLLGAGQVNEEEHVLPAEAGITTNKTQHCLYYRNEVPRLKRWICLIWSFNVEFPERFFLSVDQFTFFVAIYNLFWLF